MKLNNLWNELDCSLSRHPQKHKYSIRKTIQNFFIQFLVYHDIAAKIGSCN
jgi:hypothetical protein